jgi:hypothetical protein
MATQHMMSSQSPTSFDRVKSAKGGPRSASKSQEDFYRYKLKTPSTGNSISNTNPNPNAYYDKITDQKFFNRNFKLKPDSFNDLNNNNLIQRYFDESTNGAEHISRLNTGYENNNNSTTTNINNNNNNNNREKSAERIGSSSFNNASSNLLLTTANNLLTNQQNNVNLNVNNQMNKLKLLKKRNALKKTLSSNNNNNQSNSTPPTTTTTTTSNLNNYRYDSTNLINSSKEDFKSQNSLNNNSKSFGNNRPLSMHLSRNSLNNLEQIPISNMSGSNPQLHMHKSSETIDELVLNEIKLKENNLDRTRSASRLNVKYNHNNIVNKSSSTLNNQIRTKSENELHNLNNETNINNNSTKKLYNNDNMENEVSYTAYKSLNMNNSFINRMKASNLNSAKLAKQTSKTPTPNNSRLDTTNINKYNSIKLNHNNKFKHNNNNNDNDDNDDYDNVVNSDQKEFRIVYPGYNPNIVSLRNHHNGIIHTTHINNELFEISPYNIMSDPVISEQFRRLYDEDEYFQQVHRKVSEWLNKYVFIEMENQTFDRTE